MRLIDADALYEKVDESQAHNNHQGISHLVHSAEHAHFKFMIHQAPTIEAEPVKHGSWKGWTTSKFTGRYKDYDEPEFKDYVYYTCSECYRKSAIQELYCPQCGTRMDGGAENA